MDRLYWLAAPRGCYAADMPEVKKRGPLFWVIVSVGALVATLAVVMVGIGYYGARDMMSTVSTSDPAFAAVKLLTLSDKNLEVIREEPEKGQILVRDKTTGQYSFRRADEETKSIRVIPVPAEDVPDELKK